MSEQKMGRRARRPTREDVYQRFDRHIAELWQRLGGLPNPLEALDIWRGIWFEEAHHSTALEGNTLVLKEVEALRERHVHRRERMHGNLPGSQALGGGSQPSCQAGSLDQADVIAALDHARIAQGPGGPAEMVPGQHHVRMHIYIARSEGGTFSGHEEPRAHRPEGMRDRARLTLTQRAPSDRWQRGAGSGPEPASPKRQRISISSKFGSCRRR